MAGSGYDGVDVDMELVKQLMECGERAVASYYDYKAARCTLQVAQLRAASVAWDGAAELSDASVSTASERSGSDSVNPRSSVSCRSRRRRKRRGSRGGAAATLSMASGYSQHVTGLDRASGQPCYAAVLTEPVRAAWGHEVTFRELFMKPGQGFKSDKQLSGLRLARVSTGCYHIGNVGVPLLDAFSAIALHDPSLPGSVRFRRSSVPSHLVGRVALDERVGFLPGELPEGAVVAGSRLSVYGARNESLVKSCVEDAITTFGDENTVQVRRVGSIEVECVIVGSSEMHRFVAEQRDLGSGMTVGRALALGENADCRYVPDRVARPTGGESLCTCETCYDAYAKASAFSDGRVDVEMMANLVAVDKPVLYRLAGTAVAIAAGAQGELAVVPVPYDGKHVPSPFNNGRLVGLALLEANLGCENLLQESWVELRGICTRTVWSNRRLALLDTFLQNCAVWFDRRPVTLSPTVLRDECQDVVEDASHDYEGFLPTTVGSKFGYRVVVHGFGGPSVRRFLSVSAMDGKCFGESRADGLLMLVGLLPLQPGFGVDRVTAVRNTSKLVVLGSGILRVRAQYPSARVFDVDGVTYGEGDAFVVVLTSGFSRESASVLRDVGICGHGVRVKCYVFEPQRMCSEEQRMCRQML